MSSRPLLILIAVFCGLTATLCCGPASADISQVAFDEIGNGSYVNGTTTTAMLSASGHGTILFPSLVNSLDYRLPFPASGATGGIVAIYDDAAKTILSDVLVFDGAWNGTIDTGKTLEVYSDDDNGVPSTSNSFLTSALKLVETQLSGSYSGDSGVTWTPTSSQPGYVSGLSVTYTFVSEGASSNVSVGTVPEPGSFLVWSVLAAVCLAFRRRRSGRPS